MARKGKQYDVRLADVVTFLAVRSHGSVTGAARATGTTPSHVSKSLARLEQQVGERLLARSSRGVTLTNAALRVLPFLVTAVDALRKARRTNDAIRDVTVVAPSYLLQAFVPALARSISTLRFRGVQMGTSAIRAQMGLRQFEVALFNGDHSNIPNTWRAEPVGDVGSGLFGPPLLARKLGRVSVEALKEVPFIIPVSFDGGQWQPEDDDCPIPLGERLVGHEAPTIALGLAIAAEAGQLVFGPRVAAIDYLRTRRLVEIPVPGWSVTRPTSLAVDIDRITLNELKQLRTVAVQVLAPT